MSAFVFAVIKTGWDKRKEQRMPVGFVVALICFVSAFVFAVIVICFKTGLG